MPFSAQQAKHVVRLILGALRIPGIRVQVNAERDAVIQAAAHVLDERAVISASGYRHHSHNG